MTLSVNPGRQEIIIFGIPRGNTGATGEQGIQGIQGEQGIQGIQGNGVGIEDVEIETQPTGRTVFKSHL